MKVTAKLAYSQIKINRSRTLWATIGIALSAALITAVCSFAVSGGALATELSGEDPGESTGGIPALLLIPAIILSLIIIAMAVVVISNSFRASAGERITQFGILKSVGATKRQIAATVMYESIFLSAAGIPLGIGLGLLLAFGGVQIANHYLGELNSLIHIMMNELIIVVDFIISWQALATAALVSFAVVLISAWRPAQTAAQITAIDSIRGAGEVKLEAKQLRTSNLTAKLFGFEGMLAAKNMKRSRRNFRASVVSLTVGIVLFINLGALSSLADAIEKMIYPDFDATVIVDYTSVRDVSVNETTGRDEVKIARPIDSDYANDVTARLREYPDTDVFGVGDDMETYVALIPREMLSSRLPQAVFYPEEKPAYGMSMELITLDTENYATL